MIYKSAECTKGTPFHIWSGNDPEGRHEVVRPKMRWIDGVQQDLRALGVRDWREVVTDRQHWNQILHSARSKHWM